MEIPDELFWKSDKAFLDRIIDNKTAYDGWVNYAMRKEAERRRGK